MAAPSPDSAADKAIDLYQQALTQNPNNAETWFALAQLYHQRGQFEQADTCYQKALALRPGLVEALNNRGSLLRQLGRPQESLECLHRAQQLRPDSAPIANNLGNLCKELGQLDQAIAFYQQALALRAAQDDTAATADAHHNLANALKDAGQISEAISSFDRALQINPAHVCAHSGKLYAMHFDPRFSAIDLLHAHQQWNKQHAEPLATSCPPAGIDRTLDRVLRIGYVSDDLCHHPVGRFLLPLLKNHDRQKFEIFCYTGVRRPDATTDELKNHTDAWRSTVGLTDAQLAQTIRNDRIDILLDLTMHMAGSRLLAFARKPAPVQVTYLAYSSTTGMGGAAMDWRLSDPYLDPPGSETPYTEKTYRLPHTYWCYQSPNVQRNSRKPNDTASITFGCLNAFAKLSTIALQTWAAILQQVPHSNLLLHAPEGAHRQRIQKIFESQNIASDRVRFVGFLPFPKYLNMYARIDIALDPFPYAGGTTSCDALWMGTPLITLASPTAVGRGGVSLLTNLQLTDLITRSKEQYIQIATALATDDHRREKLIQELPERMKNSLLMNAPAFARDIEAAYRQIWKMHCQSPSAHTS